MNKRIQEAFEKHCEMPYTKDALKFGEHNGTFWKPSMDFYAGYLAALPKWSKPCDTCGGRGYMPGTFGDSNLIIDSSDPCPDCTDGRQYIDIDDNLRRFTQVVRQYINDPECKAAKQAMINGLEYIESFQTEEASNE